MKNIIAVIAVGALLASAAINPAFARMECTTSVSCTVPIIPPTPPRPECTVTVSCTYK
jgi:hypothetical protein